MSSAINQDHETEIWLSSTPAGASSISLVRSDAAAASASAAAANIPGTNTTTSTSSRILVEDVVQAVEHLRSNNHTLHELIAAIHSKPTKSSSSISNNMAMRMQDLASKWRAVQLRCESHPSEAARDVLDRRGRTSLHAACAKRPPLSVVQALLKATTTATTTDDDATSQQQVLIDRDKHGRTPLRIAIASDASVPVLQTLLRANVHSAAVADRAGDLPLHVLATYGSSSISCHDDGDFVTSSFVQLLLEAHPSGAAQTNRFGRTPLHCALEAATLDVRMIQTLVDAHPTAVVATDKFRESPLFIATRRRAPVQVIQILTDAHPTAIVTRDSLGGLPLHRAVEQQCPPAILECLLGRDDGGGNDDDTTTTAASIVLDAHNVVGNTVLHQSLECQSAREATVRLLVRRVPQVATQTAKSGHTPLTLACDRYVKDRKRRRQEIIGDNHDDDDDDDASVRTPLWSILCVLLRAAQYGRLRDEDPVVHAAVSNAVPLQVTKAALRLYPKEIQTADRDGKYPLELAIEGDAQKIKSDIVMELLEACPKVATFAVDNNKKKKKKTRSMLCRAAGAKSIASPVLKALVQAHPTALRTLDPVTGLYPFQVAALPKTDEKAHGVLPRRIWSLWDQAVDEDLLQLSAIFELFQAAPDLVGVL